MKRFSNKSSDRNKSDELQNNKRPRFGSITSTNASTITSTVNKKATNFDELDPFGDDDDDEDLMLAATQAENIMEEPFKRPKGIQPFNNRVYYSPSSSSSTLNRINATSKVESNVDVKNLQTKLNEYEKRIASMNDSFSSKDGETRILRERLGKNEKELHDYKLLVKNLQEKKDNEKSEKQQELEKQLENVRGLVEFKDAELMESKNIIRTLEQKNKMLVKNHQLSASAKESSSGTSGTTLKRSADTFPANDWEVQQSQEIGGVGKRLKFVKPKPTASVTRKNSIGKQDEVKSKISPRKTTPIKTKFETRLKESPKQRQGSKFLSRWPTMHADLLKVQIVDNEAVPSIPLLTCLQSGDSLVDDVRPINISSIAHKTHMKSAIQGLQNLSVTTNPLGTQDQSSSDMQDYLQLLPIVESALAQYVAICQNIVRQVSTNNNEPKKPIAPIPEEQICSSTEKVVAGLQMLKTIIEHVPSVVKTLTNQTKSDDCHSVIKNIKVLCSDQYWCYRLPSCYDITSTALSALALFLKAAKGDEDISRHFQICEPQVRPLFQCEQSQMKCNLLDVLIASLHIKGYAEDLVKGGAKSVLYRVCELYRQKQPPVISESSWLNFLTKALGLMTVYTSKYKEILIKEQCFAEIYYASDVMLYNQLVKRKKDVIKNNKRDQIICNALGLLHACQGVYKDGIPDSRRETKHSVMLLMLEKFHNEIAVDQSSFWNQELKSVIESEVKNLYEDSNLL